ncbi:MAG: hypothetical protein RLZZ305_203 [Actinomycetota bacterium]
MLLLTGAIQLAGPLPQAGAAGVLCTNGTSALANPYTVSINGAPVTASEPGRYDKYWVLVCNDKSNRDYLFQAGLYDPNTSNGMGRFTAADLNTEFTVSFLPDPGTSPMVVEGHGVMSNFVIDAADSNRVTVTSKPISYSDIYGSDCGNVGPAECVLAVKNMHGDRASADNIEIRVGVRYAEEGKPSEGDFALLKGMRWSSSAYYFWMRTSCPTGGATNSAISIEVGGPHFKADGTQNFGDITVFIPTTAVLACFGAPPSVAKDALAVSRTVNGTTTSATTGTAADAGLVYTVSADDATGLTLNFPQVTFSKPSYAVATKSGKSLAKKTVTYAKLLQLALIKKPSGGSVKLTSRSGKVCAGAGTKMFAWAKGTCKVSVASYSKTGKKLSSKTVTFPVSA